MPACSEEIPFADRKGRTYLGGNGRGVHPIKIQCRSDELMAQDVVGIAPWRRAGARRSRTAHCQKKRQPARNETARRLCAPSNIPPRTCRRALWGPSQSDCGNRRPSTSAGVSHSAPSGVRCRRRRRAGTVIPHDREFSWHQAAPRREHVGITDQDVGPSREAIDDFERRRPLAGRVRLRVEADDLRTKCASAQSCRRGCSPHPEPQPRQIRSLRPQAAASAPGRAVPRGSNTRTTKVHGVSFGFPISLGFPMA